MGSWMKAVSLPALIGVLLHVPYALAIAKAPSEWWVRIVYITWFAWALLALWAGLRAYRSRPSRLLRSACAGGATLACMQACFLALAFAARPLLPDGFRDHPVLSPEEAVSMSLTVAAATLVGLLGGLIASRRSLNHAA